MTALASIELSGATLHYEERGTGTPLERLVDAATLSAVMSRRRRRRSG